MDNRLTQSISDHKKYYFWHLLIGLVGFTLPFSPKVNSLFIVLLLVSWLIYRIKGWNTEQFKAIPFPFILLFGFYIWGALSLIYTEEANLLKGYHVFVENRMPLMLLPLILFTGLKDKNYIIPFYIYLSGLFLFCLLLNIEVINKILVNHEPFSYFFTKYVRTEMLEGARFGMHSMYLSMMLLLALIVNLYLAYYTKLFSNRWVKFFLTLISAYFLVMLYLVGARMSILTLGVLGFLWLQSFCLKITGLKFSTRFIVSLIIAITIVLVGLHYKDRIALMIEAHFDLQQLHNESTPTRIVDFLLNGDRARGISWKSAIDVFKEHPWIGVGGGDGLTEMQKVRPKDSWSYEKGANAHNQYLDTAVQLGLVGLLLWFGFYFGLMIYGLQQENYLLIIFLLIIGIALITESMLQEHRGLVFISYFSPLFALYKSRTIV